MTCYQKCFAVVTLTLPLIGGGCTRTLMPKTDHAGRPLQAVIYGTATTGAAICEREAPKIETIAATKTLVEHPARQIYQCSDVAFDDDGQATVRLHQARP